MNVSVGAGVSVKPAVGVREAVSVEAGSVNNPVGGFSVAGGSVVPAGKEGSVRLQASELRINRVGKTSFRLISEF